MADDNTPNHGLHQYDRGSIEWTHSLDMDHIERHLPITGHPENERSEFEPHSTAQFIADDTGAVYEGDWDGWALASRRFDSLHALQLELDGQPVATETYVDAEVSAEFSEIESAPYVTVGASGALTNETSHADLSGADLHDPAVHGNEAHSDDYATGDDIAAYAATDPHGNEAHSETYITEGDIFSGSYTDLTDVPTEFAPEAHGDAAHTVDYAEASQLFSGSYTDLTDVPTAFAPETHDNSAHSTDYVNGDEMASYVDSAAVEEARLWDGYEIVVDDETPETNQYIRFDTTT